MKRPLLLTLLLALATPLVGQTPTGSLIGRVTSGGSPAAGASVTVSSDQVIGIRTTVTGPTGEYAVSGLPPGRYSVTFEHEGMQTVTRAAELHVAITSRADAELKRTEVGESITLTAPTPSILQTPEVATNFETSLIDLLPVGRSVRERTLLGPGAAVDVDGAPAVNGAPSSASLYLIDGVRTHLTGTRAEPVIEEAIDETTMLTGAEPAEYGRFSGGVIVAVTRSGGNDFSGSIREELDADRDNLLQATVGGRAVRDRLWFFGAGAHGDGGPADQRRWQGKMTGGLTDSQMIAASYTQAVDEEEPHRSHGSAYYDAALGSRSTLEALYGKETDGGRSWLVKGSYFVSSASAGSHSIAAGYQDARDAERGAAFVQDQWKVTQRWAVSAGARYDDAFSPRAGMIYDLHGDGLRRVSAGWGRYVAENGQRFDETTVGYGAQIANNGFLRAEAIRRTRRGADDYRAIEVQGSYTLVGLVTVGGNISVANLPDSANVWLLVQPPFPFGRLSIAALQRYHGGNDTTDLAATYSFPIGPLSWFVKADLLNAFDQDNTINRRTERFAAGVRF